MNFNIKNLYSNNHLARINADFFTFLTKNRLNLAQQLKSAKEDKLDKRQESDLLIEISKILEDFLVNLFGIESENKKLQQKHYDLAIIYKIKRNFVQRVVAKELKEQIDDFDGFRFLQDKKITGDIDEIELKLAQKIDKSAEEDLEILKKYSAWALYSDKGKKFHRNGALFILPQKIDYQNLINPSKIEQTIDPSNRGFNLTDQGYNLNRNLSEANYCIFCHKQEKDSCRKGVLNQEQSQSCKTNPLGIDLHGCPLDEKISEMNLLKSQGFSIAALAMAIIDNPMIAGTGHRICNDCMKSCIYQKQDPVDIPQIESRILKDVLALPYGFEIYSLLTRWNPLNLENTLPKKSSGKKILICGLGPAGYTLAHYLLNEGHEIVAIDGLKIEPLNPKISGIDELGNRCDFKPIKYLDEIYEPLSSRQIGGFGGVAEYGITVRWDKNFLKVIRLLLERRENFQMFGGIRFGSSITDKMAFETYDFDHIALCIGAGKPKIIDIENNFAKGVRLASDFLMSLQLTGAFKEELFTNLQIRLPIIVIGGGLTAIDTACEAQAYYFVQIKKFAQKVKILGKKNIWPLLNEEEKIIATEFLKDHERLNLHQSSLNNNLCHNTSDAHDEASNSINDNEFCHSFPAVKVIYRKKIQDSPSYRLNHEELKKAFEQNIEFIEEKRPKKAILDDFGHINSLECSDGSIFNCKSLLIAAGTLPNISPVTQDKIDINLDGKYFSQVKELNNGLNFITKINKNNQAISFFGDLHPDFEGNVVKAMASAKYGYQQINEILLCNDSSHKAVLNDDLRQTLGSAQSRFSDKALDNSTNNEFCHDDFRKKIATNFVAQIHKIERLSPYVIEITIHAPLLVKNTQVGQIFRLQNFHKFAKKIKNQIAAMEGIALTALDIDRKNGLISGIAVETGGSTSLIQYFKVGEPCVFMGPSGEATNIPKNETVVIIGGGRGNQPLTALAEAFMQNGCKVIFFAGYRKNDYVARQERMENSCHQIIFAIEEEKPNLKLNKSTSRQFCGTVIDAIKDYFLQHNTSNARSYCGDKASGNIRASEFYHDKLEKKHEDIGKIDRIFTIGNNYLMHEIAKLRHKNIVPAFKEAKYAITSLNSPMQCMMKGVCAQCLQKRVNDAGETEYFYSCANQDQNMDNFDFQHLHYRCEQNSLSEKITKLWINYINN